MPRTLSGIGHSNSTTITREKEFLIDTLETAMNPFVYILWYMSETGCSGGRECRIMVAEQDTSRASQIT